MKLPADDNLPMKTNALNGGSRPVPDPTVLTTDQLRREVGALRELIEARLTGNDEAVRLLRDAGDRIPASIDAKMSRLRELHDEKFHSIDTQFKERDERTQKTAELNQKAIDAALQAQKEAANAQTLSLTASIAKSETGFTKEIDGIKTLIATGNKGTDDKFEDVKGRLSTLESSINTRQVVTTESRGQANWLVGILVVGALSCIGIAVSIVSILINK